MGLFPSRDDPAVVARATAEGRKYMTHIQALVDSLPSSELSDEQKQHCFKVLEEHPLWAWILLCHSNVIPHRLRIIKQVVARTKLEEPNRPHHYRGYAERIPPDAPPVVAPEAAAASMPASEAAPSSSAPASSGASSNSSAVSSARTAAEADCALGEELISLLAKKTQ